MEYKIRAICLKRNRRTQEISCGLIREDSKLTEEEMHKYFIDLLPKLKKFTVFRKFNPKSYEHESRITKLQINLQHNR